MHPSAFALIISFLNQSREGAGLGLFGYSLIVFPTFPLTAIEIAESIPKLWAGDISPTAGNANSIDTYLLTVIKTNAAPAYTVFGQQVQFA